MKKDGRRSKGAGSVYSVTGRGAMKFAASIKPPTGPRQTRYGKTKKEAEDKLYQLRREIDGGLHGSIDKAQTLAEFAAAWYAGRQHIRRSNTVRGYESTIRNHLDGIGKERLDRLTPAMIQAHYTRKLQYLATSSVHRIHAHLHLILEQAVKLDLIPRNPCDRVDAPPNTTKEFRVWTAQEAARFLVSITGTRDEVIAALALATGLRISEILGLRWGDLDLASGSVTVAHTLHFVNSAWVLETTKSRMSRRTAQLPPGMADLLARWRIEQNAQQQEIGAAWDNALGLVFTWETGMPIHMETYIMRFYALCALHGVPRIRVHDLRHTFATLLLEAGVAVKVVSELLGHANVTITLRTYGHITPKMRDQGQIAIGQIFKIEGKAE